jgi:pyruvate dehydrogenase E2 component (dihydrolipoamide acetyltransferase)
MPEVIMPKMGDAMEEGTLLQWLKQDGETVKVGEVIAEIETDKSNVEIEAEDAGVLHIQAQTGAVVPVGKIIALIGDSPSAQVFAPAQTAEKARESASEYDTPIGSPVKTAAPPVVSAPTRSAPTNGTSRLKASPLARSVAKQRGLDIAQIKGTGPQGRIIEADVLAFVAPAPTVQAVPQKRADATPAPMTQPTELSAMRKVIARRMVESKTTIPHFYITAEVDMAEAMVLREKLNAYDETLPKISLNDMVVKASAKALVKFPAVNAMFKDDKVYPGAGFHVGVAVALDDGLIVPVIRDADSLPLRKLADTSKGLIKKARDKKLQPSEYTGGTFTVSNLGPFDVESFIAIIDPSQGAILAVSSITKKAVVLDDDTIVVRPRMNLTFSGDHRVMDGAVGAKFLQELKKLLQNPLSLLE